LCIICDLYIEICDFFRHGLEGMRRERAEAKAMDAHPEAAEETGAAVATA
jgi:hypothetical protein